MIEHLARHWCLLAAAAVAAEAPLLASYAPRPRLRWHPQCCW